MSPFPGPTPAYSNVPIHPEWFKPRVFQIANIDIGRFTIVTTVQDMDYVVGQLVRLHVPQAFGCRQLNESQGYVVEIGADNEVTIDIDSSDMDEFTSYPLLSNQPHIAAIGDVNYGYLNPNPKNQALGIPGDFKNISPNG